MDVIIQKGRALGKSMNASMAGMLFETKVGDLTFLQYYRAVQIGRINKVWTLPYSGGILVSFDNDEGGTHVWSLTGWKKLSKEDS